MIQISITEHLQPCIVSARYSSIVQHHGYFDQRGFSVRPAVQLPHAGVLPKTDMLIIILQELFPQAISYAPTFGACRRSACCIQATLYPGISSPLYLMTVYLGRQCDGLRSLFHCCDLLIKCGKC